MGQLYHLLASYKYWGVTALTETQKQISFLFKINIYPFQKYYPKPGFGIKQMREKNA